ncbi:hypothetical protein FKM82_006573 [Ascaphus truei]
MCSCINLLLPCWGSGAGESASLTLDSSSAPISQWIRHVWNVRMRMRVARGLVCLIAAPRTGLLSSVVFSSWCTSQGQ